MRNELECIQIDMFWSCLFLFSENMIIRKRQERPLCWHSWMTQVKFWAQSKGRHVTVTEWAIKHMIRNLMRALCAYSGDSWWRHQLGNIFRVTGPFCGEFTGHRWIPAQRPVTRSFDVFFDLRQKLQLSKRWRRRWIQTPSHSLWHHCNVSQKPLLSPCWSTGSAP